jgi:hypothetical protein
MTEGGEVMDTLVAMLDMPVSYNNIWFLAQIETLSCRVHNNKTMDHRMKHKRTIVKNCYSGGADLYLE